MLDTLLTRLRGALGRETESTALPMMDGPLKPNRRLEDASVLGESLSECDDLVAIGDGAILASAGARIHRLAGADLGQRSVWFDGLADGLESVGPLARGGQAIYAGIAGKGVVRIENGHVVSTLSVVDGLALRCATALTVLADGSLAIAEGSTVNGVEAWSRDLLERRATGRILRASADLASASTLASGLAWPSGLAQLGDQIWYSEAWRHRVQAMSLAGGAARGVLRNLPGYPARMAREASGDVWIAVFAVRTLLLEFVLREHDYRTAMLETVDPRYWIAPSFGATGHHLEPLQGGSIKKLGITKPWAPPRSYGLVLRVSEQGEVLDSLHSRVGGLHHGITAVQPHGGRLIALSRGSGRVLACNPERVP